MAAVDPSESPKRQKSPAEEVETSGEKTEAVESGCSFSQKDETTHNKTAKSPDDERRASVGNDGGSFSHSEVSVESGAGAEKTTCNSTEDLTTAEKMAEAPGSDQRDFDWSEPEDDGEEAKTHTEENDKCGMLTLLMYFTVSFSLRANPSCSSHYRLNNSANDNYHNKIKLASISKGCDLHFRGTAVVVARRVLD